MPNYWMLVGSPQNFWITREHAFTIQGVETRHRRKARRMQPGDRILYYLTGVRRFAATATITSAYREDHTPIWEGEKPREDYPLRVSIKPEVVLEEEEWLDARELGPTLEYVRKWPPESWPLAFQGNMHLLSQRDFHLLEEEMRRVAQKRQGEVSNV